MAPIAGATEEPVALEIASKVVPFIFFFRIAAFFSFLIKGSTCCFATSKGNNPSSFLDFNLTIANPWFTISKRFTSLIFVSSLNAQVTICLCKPKFATFSS